MPIRPWKLLSLPVLIGIAACASSSKYEGLDAMGVYALGQHEMAEEDYGDAAETLDRLLLVYPTFEQAAEASFLLGSAYYLDEKYITAASQYTTFLDRFPTHPRAPEAALGVCRSYAALSPISQRDQTFTDQALTVCRNVVTDYRTHAVAEEAATLANDMRAKLARKVFENGSYYLRRDMHDSAIIYFEDVVANYPDTDYAPQALLGIIEAYGEIGYEDEVERARNRLLSEYPDSEAARSLNSESGAPAGATGSGL